MARRLGGAKATVTAVRNRGGITVTYDDPDSRHWNDTFAHYFYPLDAVSLLAEVASG